MALPDLFTTCGGCGTEITLARATWFDLTVSTVPCPACDAGADLDHVRRNIGPMHYDATHESGRDYNGRDFVETCSCEREFTGPTPQDAYLGLSDHVEEANEQYGETARMTRAQLFEQLTGLVTDYNALHRRVGGHVDRLVTSHGPNHPRVTDTYAALQMATGEYADKFASLAELIIRGGVEGL